MSHIPYASFQPPQPPATRPGAVTAFYVYCGLMVLVYLLVAGIGVLYLVLPAEMVADEPDMTVQEAQIMGGVILGLGAVFAVIYGILPFLPRRTWSWVVGIIGIAFGLTSCCFWPFAIPLLIFYLQAPTRLWYSQATAPPPGTWDHWQGAGGPGAGYGGGAQGQQHRGGPPRDDWGAGGSRYGGPESR